jgi:uncharacterized membrane protein
VSASRLRPALVAALILGYALLEHYSNRAAAPRPLGALLAIGPPLLALALLARRARYAQLLLPLVLLAALALLWWLWPHLERHFARLYLLQQCSIYLSLALAFGYSLLPGHTPLCTRWATMVHGSLDRAALRYTRSVTGAWTLFFLGIVLTSSALFLAAPRLVWSAFSNFAVLPLAALMFGLEQRARRRQLPAMKHVGAAETLRIYLTDRRSRSALGRPS